MIPIEKLTPRDQKRIMENLDNQSKIIGVDDYEEEFKVTYCDGENHIKHFRVKKFRYSNNFIKTQEKLKKAQNKEEIHCFSDDHGNIKMALNGTGSYELYLKHFKFVGVIKADG